MYESIINILSSALSAVFNWFTTFFGIYNSAFLGLFIAMFVVFMAVRFLIIPLVGGSAPSPFENFSGKSDSVKSGKSDKAKSDKKDNPNKGDAK